VNNEVGVLVELDVEPDSLAAAAYPVHFITKYNFFLIPAGWNIYIEFSPLKLQRYLIYTKLT
jgi:hypothetical protein